MFIRVGVITAISVELICSRYSHKSSYDNGEGYVFVTVTVTAWVSVGASVCVCHYDCDWVSVGASVCK